MIDTLDTRKQLLSNKQLSMPLLIRMGLPAVELIVVQKLRSLWRKHARREDVLLLYYISAFINDLCCCLNLSAKKRISVFTEWR
eukprot:1473595-Pleurochrysis_carterae.AAC.1